MISFSALEFFAWRKLTDDEQTKLISTKILYIFILISNSLLQRPAVYHEKTQVILKSALKDAEDESALQGVSRMDVEIKRAIKFLQISTDLRQYQKRADVSVSIFFCS